MLDKSSRLLSYAGAAAEIDGVAVSVQVKEGYTALSVDTGGEKCLLRIKGIDEIAAYDLVGRHIVARGKITEPDGKRNRGGFDYKLYLKARAVYTIADVSRFKLQAGRVQRPIEHALSLCKGRFYQAIKPLMSEDDFSVLAGLLFGDKNYMDDELYEQYQLSGISHVLAVSGLHVGLLYAVIVKLSGGKKSLRSTIITCICLYLYAALSSFSISVLRACCMIALRLLAFHIDRRYDSVCAAAITAIIFLFVNPYQLFDAGFQLSFTAAYSMGVALPYMETKFEKFVDKRRNKCLQKLGKVLLPCLAVQLGMTPLTLFHFLNISPIAILLNPIAIAIAGLLLPAGLLLFVISALGIALVSAAASGPVQLLIRLMSLLSLAGEKSGLAGPCPAPPLHLLLLYYLLFFYFFSETRIKLNRQGRYKELSFAACTILAIAVFMPKSYQNPPVTFVDVGQGDCIHICYEGFNVLIDGGGNYYKNIGKETLRSYLLKNGISSIDLAIITHQDQDHAKGIRELAECFNIKKLYEKAEGNEDCTICSAELEGIRFLFMADADKERERMLLTAYPGLKCDVLKIAHHGSAGASSEEFLEAVCPSAAIISCGRNNVYGHPAAEVLERLEHLNVPVLRTDILGAVSFKGCDSKLLFQSAAGNDIIFELREE